MGLIFVGVVSPAFTITHLHGNTLQPTFYRNSLFFFCKEFLCKGIFVQRAHSNYSLEKLKSYNNIFENTFVRFACTKYFYNKNKQITVPLEAK